LIPAVAQDQSLLVIYNQPSDLSFVSSHIDRSITSVSISSVTAAQIADANDIILVSSTEFSLSTTVENAILNHVQQSDSKLLLLTPFLDEFENSSLQKFGISGAIEVIGEENPVPNFTVQLNDALGNYSSGATFTYSGIAGIIDQQSSPITPVASFTESDHQGEDNLTLPAPAIINATVPGQVLTVPIAVSPQTVENDLHLNQLDDFIQNLLTELLVVSFNNYQGPSGTGQQPTNNQGNSSPPIAIDFNFIYALLAGLIVMLALLYQKVLGFFAWLNRKIFGILFGVVGVFYNIQDRTLDYNDIMLNTMRVDIIDYLEYLGEYGAYLSELKNELRAGTGALLWHLQVLQDFGMIEQFNINDYTVFVAAESISKFNPELKSIELKLKSKYLIDLLTVLIDYTYMEKIPLGAIEDQVETTRRTLRRLLKKMEKEELVKIELTPSMVITITDKTKLTRLHESLYRRENYHKDPDTTTVTQLADDQ